MYCTYPARKRVCQTSKLLFKQPLCCFLNPLSPAKTMFHAELCNPITCQAIELESCSNPLSIHQVLQSKSKKKFSFSVGCFRGGTPQVGVFIATFTWPWAPTHQAIIMAHDFLGNQAKIPILEPLNDILAYLQPNLQTKHQKLVKISAPSNPTLSWKISLF